MTELAAVPNDPLDAVRLAHDFRRWLWQEYGERSVPRMWIAQDECGLEVRGTTAHYIVQIREEKP